MTKSFAPIFTPQEADVLLQCINLAVANLGAALGQGGVGAIEEATAKLKTLRELADKISTSEQDAVQDVAETA